MKKKKKSKMIYVYIGVLIILFGSIFIVSNSGKDNVLYGMPLKELNPQTRALLNNPNYQNIILPDDLQQKIDNKEDFFVYMFSASCGYCKTTTPVLVPLVDELGIELPMFNLLEFPFGQRQYNIDYTPTVLYFKDGVEEARIVGGYVEDASQSGNTLDHFKQFFLTHSGADLQ